MGQTLGFGVEQYVAGLTRIGIKWLSYTNMVLSSLMCFIWLVWTGDAAIDLTLNVGANGVIFNATNAAKIFAMTEFKRAPIGESLSWVFVLVTDIECVGRREVAGVRTTFFSDNPAPADQICCSEQSFIPIAARAFPQGNCK